MSRRRPPRGAFQRLADGTKNQRTGGAGLVYNAAPIWANVSAAQEALASVAGVTQTAWNDETFTLASDGAQDVTLEFLPVDESEDVKLNGLGQLRTTEWSVSGQTLSVLSAMGALTGDKLTVHYQYLTGQPAVIIDATGYTLHEGIYFTATNGGEGPTAERSVSDTVGSGWLRFTNATDTRVGAFTSTETFASGQAITVEFDYATHGGDGADGICLFLMDGAATVPSSWLQGGSLGYADLVGGFLGIGFDERGNFALQLSGNPGTSADYVVLGGPESGGNDYITRGSVSPNAIDGHDRTAPVHVEVTISAALVVTVQMDFGSGLTTYVNAVDCSAVCGTPPSTYRIGMAGTTGTQNNIHEIRNFDAASGSFSLAISGTETG